MAIPFSAIGTALDGSIGTEPRVTKKVLVQSLQSNTATVNGVITNMAEMQGSINGLVQTTDETGRRVGGLDAQVADLTSALGRANAALAEQDRKFAVLGDLSVLAGLGARMQSAEAEVVSLKADYVGRLDAMGQRVSALEGAAAAAAGLMDAQRDALEELKGEISSSTQELTDAVALLPAMQDGLRTAKADIDGLKVFTQVNASGVAANLSALEGKADGARFNEVEHMVLESKETTEKLGAHVAKLSQEMGSEEGGGPAMERLRKALNETRESMEHMNTDLQSKVNESDVDEKLQRQYDSVLVQVNAAVGSIDQDDGELKRVARELQAMIKKVQANMVHKKDFHVIKQQLDEDSRLKQQLELLRTLVDDRITIDSAKELIDAKPGKTELVALMRQMTSDMGNTLRSDMDMALDDEAGAPWATQTNLAGSMMPSQRELGSPVKIPYPETTDGPQCNHRGAKNSMEPSHCLSCHRRFDAFGGNYSSGPPTAAEDIMAVQGPGGTSLGGGFNAKLSVRPPQRLDAFNTLPSEGALPKLDMKRTHAAPTTPYVIGADGQVYHGYAKPERAEHLWSTSPNSSSLRAGDQRGGGGDYASNRIPTALSASRLAAATTPPRTAPAQQSYNAIKFAGADPGFSPKAGPGSGGGHSRKQRRAPSLSRSLEVPGNMPERGRVRPGTSPAKQRNHA